MLQIRDYRNKTKLIKENWRKVIRLCHSEILEEPHVKRKYTKGKIHSEIRRYFDSSPQLQMVSKLVPQKFFKTKLIPSDYSFLVDDNIACEIVELIKNRLHPDIPVIEANPGAGLITRHLLGTGIKKLFLFESKLNPMLPVQQLVEDNPDRVMLIPTNIFEMYKVIAQDKMDNGDRFETMMMPIATKQWTDDPACAIIGITHTFGFIKFLIKSIINHDVFTKIGRTDNFLIVTEEHFTALNGQPMRGFWSKFPFFQLFFHIKELAKLPRKAFLPWNSSKKPMDERFMYLVQITPARDIYQRFSYDQLKLLVLFVNTVTRSRTTNVVGLFESWSPNSGLKLVQEGINPMTQMGDLSVTDIYELFNLFISLPNFDPQQFIQIVESSNDPPPAEKSRSRNPNRRLSRILKWDHHHLEFSNTEAMELNFDTMNV